MAGKKAPFGLDQWLEELSRMEAVSMGAVIRKLNQLTASQESSVQQLSNEILKDPSLTSKILKVSNSVIYNPTKTPITTVSRAIMHIGFDTVRAICVSAKIIEGLLKSHPREVLLKQLARSFHAAVQARNLCEKARGEVKEEVFVGGLLMHLGELLIWSYPDDTVDHVYQLYRRGASERELEAKLGVTFNRLTVEVVSEWHLGNTLAEALSGEQTPGEMAEAVRLGDEISMAMELGWKSPAMKEVLKKVAAFTSKSEVAARKLMQQSTSEAAQLSKIYGDPKLTQLIQDTARRAEGEQTESGMLQPDPQLQLEILQSIMKMMTTGLDTGELFKLVLSGLHKGVGLERVALALLNQSRTELRAKSVMGSMTGKWKESFRFRYERSHDNLFAQVLASRSPCWLGHADFRQLTHLRRPDIEKVLGTGDCLIAPVLANEREIGVIYADMQVTGRQLTDQYFMGFRHFTQQINLCLGLLANNG